MQRLLKIEVILAVILFAAFFLPWIDLPFSSDAGSAFEIAVNLGGKALLLFSIPLAAITILVLAIYDASTKIATIVAGLIPFAFFIRTYIKAGERMFNDIEFGVYITLAVGFLLFLVGTDVIKSSFFLKKMSSN